VLTEAQTTLADRALAMRDRRVADVMVRWSDVAWIGVNADRAAREMVLARRSFSRLPVMDGHRRVAGVVWWVDALLRPEEPTEALIRPAPALSRQTPILEALSILRYRRQAMAIIVDDAGQRPIGLVTLKDLVEPLTGKLAAW